MRFLLLFFILSIIITGCYYDKAELAYPVSANPTACDTTGTTYSSTVSSILNTNCYSCHSGNAAAGAGIKLDTYSGVVTYINNGQLMGAINQNGSMPAMPPGGYKLAACDINKIQAWIIKGKPNN